MFCLKWFSRAWQREAEREPRYRNDKVQNQWEGGRRKTNRAGDETERSVMKGHRGRRRHKKKGCECVILWMGQSVWETVFRLEDNGGEKKFLGGGYCCCCSVYISLFCCQFFVCCTERRETARHTLTCATCPPVASCTCLCSLSGSSLHGETRETARYMHFCFY